MMKRLKSFISDEKVQRYAFFAILLIYAALLLTVNLTGFKAYCTADMLSDINIARLMWEQKTLFPEGWVFGNQYYVIATPVLCSLIYGLTGSSVASMNLATVIMSVLEVAAFIWMLSPLVKDSRDAGFRSGAAVALLSTVVCVNAPFSFVGQLFFTMASYYACYVIVIYAAVGHYIRLFHSQRTRRERITTLAGASVLCFCTGMQSLRQTAVLLIPLCGFEALRLLYDGVIKKRGIRLLPTVHTAIMTAANLLGCLFIKLLDVPNISIYSGNNSGFSVGFNPAGARSSLICIFEILGLDYLVHPEKARLLLVPVLSLCCIGVTVLAAVMMYRRRELRSGWAAVMAVLGLSIAAVFGISLFTDMQMRPIYYFTIFPLFAVAFAYCLSRLDGLRRGIFAAGFVCFALVSAFCAFMSPVKLAAQGTVDANNEAMAQFIIDSGRDIVYGNWDTADDAVAYAAETLTAGYGEMKNPSAAFEIYPYLNLPGIYSEADNSRAVYMIESAYAPVMVQKAAEAGAEMTLIYVSGDGAYELYTSSKQLMHYSADYEAALQ